MKLCASFEGVFRPDEVSSIHRLGADEKALKGTVDNAAQTIRNSSILWLAHEGWIAERLEEVLRHANERHFGFQIGGFAEPFQYATYGIGSHYGWHMDQGAGPAPRKLSLSVQLSQPDEYEGGELEMNLGSSCKAVQKDAGSVVVFPSYVVHRVRPVSGGTRRSLVAWASGEPFK